MKYIIFGFAFLMGAVASNYLWGPYGEGISGFSLGMASGMLTIGILSLFDKWFDALTGRGRLAGRGLALETERGEAWN